MHILSTHRLAKALAAGQVSEREKAYYLLAGWVLYTALGYSTIIFANQGRTWLALFELLMIVVIAVLGFQRCYEASGGDANKHFVVDFTCLLVPLTLRTYAAVWGLYWLVFWAFYFIAGTDAAQASENSARTVEFLWGNAGWFTTLAAVLATQAVLFWRMRVHLSEIAALRAQGA